MIMNQLVNYQKRNLFINVLVNCYIVYSFSKKTKKYKSTGYGNYTISRSILLSLLSLLYVLIQSKSKLQNHTWILQFNKYQSRELAEFNGFCRKEYKLSELKKRISKKDMEYMWLSYMDYKEEKDCKEIYAQFEEEWKKVIKENSIDKKWAKKIMKVWYTELSRMLLSQYLNEYKELEENKNGVYTVSQHIEYLNSKLNQWKKSRHNVKDKWKSFMREAVRIWNDYILHPNERILEKIIEMDEQ